MHSAGIFWRTLGTIKHNKSQQNGIHCATFALMLSNQDDIIYPLEFSRKLVTIQVYL
jgi:hypothetical protein